MKAIETRYKGYRFRSRLEARWAVFFDYCELEWTYEPEGWQLPSGWYLPDFRITSNVSIWFEVKGQQPNQREVQVLTELVNETGYYGLFGVGEHVYSHTLHYEKPADFLRYAHPQAASMPTHDLQRITTDALHAARAARFGH